MNKSIHQTVRSAAALTRQALVAAGDAGRCARKKIMRPKTRIMYMENKSENGLVGSARIGRVKFSKSGKSVHYKIKLFKLKKVNKLDDAYINIKGFDISYSEMFIEIDEQDLSSVSKYPRIYFGKAFVNFLKNGDYSINFANELRIQSSSIMPSLYLPKKLIRDSFSKKVQEKKFQALSAKNDPSIWAFVYSKPFANEKSETTYINFHLKKMDLLDFREKI